MIQAGPLRRAVSASSAIPGVLPPVEWNGKLLIDGGWSSKVPVLAAFKMGADAVIAVDISQELRDTRKLTRLLREKGAQAGCIMTGDKVDEVVAVIAARKFPGLKGMDLAKVVTTKRGFQWNEGNLWPESARAPIRSPQRLHVVAYDFGIKRNILRLLADSGCRMTVVPAQTSAQDALALAPDGIFLSNGPGDPEPCTYAIEATKKFLCTDLPVFGICLGHQILGLAAGARTVKMKFGHHGANHPVQDLESGRVFIMCQNHGFAVDETTLPEGVKATHRSLFDGSLQGIAFSERPVFGFQGHPEASPGPHDLRPLFERFNHLMLRRLQAQLRAAEDTLRRQLVGGGR